MEPTPVISGGLDPNLGLSQIGTNWRSSLIDRETLYVVAEASQSLNLGKNDVYDDDGDGLWMGCGHGPVAGTLCEVRAWDTRHCFLGGTMLNQHATENNYFEANHQGKIPVLCGERLTKSSDLPGDTLCGRTPSFPLLCRNSINYGERYQHWKFICDRPAAQPVFDRLP
jgi:hypothetical protein